MKLICFDCDSTLSEIEGVDELAAAKGEDIKKQIEDLTNQAMSGAVAIEDIFKKRLDIIQPTPELCEEVGQLYIEKEAKGAKTLISKLIAENWKVIIISGGFIQPIKPFAEYLGVEEIYAVPLIFDNDIYAGFESTPTTRNGGKPEIIRDLKAKYNPEVIVMVGDGVSDLETKPEVDLFIGYGEFTPRTTVIAESDAFAYDFCEIEKNIQIYA